MKRLLSFALLVFASATLTATASPDAKGPSTVATEAKEAQPHSFRFSGGDPDRGMVAFIQMDCVKCHTVKGTDLKQSDAPRLDLALAAEVRFVKSYEDIITAITNPRHVMQDRYKALLQATSPEGDVEPFMPMLSAQMTAQQLIDIVTFLDSVYAETASEYRK